MVEIISTRDLRFRQIAVVNAHYSVYSLCSTKIETLFITLLICILCGHKHYR